MSGNGSSPPSNGSDDGGHAMDEHPTASVNKSSPSDAVVPECIELAVINSRPSASTTTAGCVHLPEEEEEDTLASKRGCLSFQRGRVLLMVIVLSAFVGVVAMNGKLFTSEAKVKSTPPEFAFTLSLWFMGASVASTLVSVWTGPRDGKSKLSTILTYLLVFVPALVIASSLLFRLAPERDFTLPSPSLDTGSCHLVRNVSACPFPEHQSFFTSKQKNSLHGCRKSSILSFDSSLGTMSDEQISLMIDRLLLAIEGGLKRGLGEENFLPLDSPCMLAIRRSMCHWFFPRCSPQCEPLRPCRGLCSQMGAACNSNSFGRWIGELLPDGQRSYYMQQSGELIGKAGNKTLTYSAFESWAKGQEWVSALPLETTAVEQFESICPLAEPGNDQLSCIVRDMLPADACLADDERDYRGRVNVTFTGIPCQKWDSQVPHQHSRTPDQLPLSGLEENYCRNPGECCGGGGGGAHVHWCSFDSKVWMCYTRFVCV